MTRYVIPAVFLLLACNLAGLSANLLPVAGSYALKECTDMECIKAPYGDKALITFKDMITKKPDALKLDIPMLDKAYYVEIHLGSPPKTRYLAIGRRDGKWFDHLYFDANGDGVITQDELIEVTFIKDVWQDKNIEEVRYIQPIEPFLIETTYTKTDGTTITKSLNYLVMIISVLSQEKFGEEDSFCGISVTLNTWFYGEITVQGDRVLKIAIIDGNQNGLFNEAKEDFLLVDADFDNQFDWNKDRKPLGKGLNGLGPDGKKVQLIPSMAAWPSNLCLAPKGATPDPVLLELK